MSKLELYFRRFLVLLVLASIIFTFTKIISAIFPPKTDVVEEAPVERPKVQSKYIALTFDDGPHIEYLYKILGVLDKNNAKATFFVVGKMVKKYPFLLEEITKRGNGVGSHTYNHPNLTSLTKDEIIKELESSRKEIKDACGVNVDIFRPPSGRYNKEVVSIASSRGFKTILWSDNSLDYGSTDKNFVLNNVLKNPCNGDIVLLHSGVKATLDALPDIIKGLKERGFEFKTVSQLIEENNLGTDAVVYKNAGPERVAIK